MLVFGKNAVYEFYINNKVKKMYLSDTFSDNRFSNISKDIPIKIVDKSYLDNLVNGLHQGIVAEIDDYQYCDIDDIIDNKENNIIIILDHIEDPHNFGAIIRTCEAAGIDGIIIPKDRSIEVNGTVIKTSVGTVESVKIAKVININDSIKELKKKGFWIVATDMDGQKYTDIDYHGKIAIVIGNEGKGISDLVKKNCDFVASIPMYGKVNSLNASVATAIFIYEIVRQTRN